MCVGDRARRTQLSIPIAVYAKTEPVGKLRALGAYVFLSASVIEVMDHVLSSESALIYEKSQTYRSDGDALRFSVLSIKLLSLSRVTSSPVRRRNV